jgi:CheY-like chemotaxis protein
MKKILIVDDDKELSEAMRLYLDSEGYTVKVCNNWDETFQQVTSTDPDLIIMDMFLGGGDGRVLGEQIKRDSRTCKIPVLMISAHPNARVLLQPLQADAFLSKPFDLNKFTGQIEKMINAGKLV